MTSNRTEGKKFKLHLYFEDFQKTALPAMINFSKGIGLPQGYVPETFYFLWDDDVIVGGFRIRHHLTPFLENLSGHIGQFIAKEFRGRGYCTQGLKMIIEEARKIVPENELYLLAHPFPHFAQGLSWFCNRKRTLFGL